MSELGQLAMLNVVLLVSRWKEHASPTARRFSGKLTKGWLLGCNSECTLLRSLVCDIA